MSKRLIVILIIISFFFLIVAFLYKPAVIFIVRKQLGGVFKQSQISIGRCDIQPMRQLSLFDIEIKRQGFYDIKVGEAGIRYNLFSILNPLSRALVLKSVKIYVNTPKQGIQDLIGIFDTKPAKPGAPVLGGVEISALTLDLNTKDALARAFLSCELDLITQTPKSLDVKIDIFEMFGLKLEGAVLKLVPRSPGGTFSITSLKYNKLGITDIKGAVKLKNTAVILSGVSAQALNGHIEGDLELKIEKEAQYTAHLKCTGLDMEKLVRDFDWQEKFEMSGKLSGEFRLRGKGAQLEILNGDFSALAPGGILTIKDEKSLKDMVRNTRWPLEKLPDLLVESFTNYSYNTAIVNAGLEEGNVILGVELEGQTGKRNLNVILHDFKFGN